ncbi:hypothetical protein N1851_023465 [Merluccius polli]|uniref:Immunoglobulin domain-containing protein n=1 Tax=Merluccius polli TaxID=89951 RepID=A0AA47NV14_MERPO|nr:hypothetical protein N1851_023465 [Merluccius polli]
MGTGHLCVLWMVVISGHGSCGVDFLQGHAGGSAVLRCSVGREQRGGSPPYGVTLRRCWLRQDQVVYMHSQSPPSVSDLHHDHHDNTSTSTRTTRVRVSGDPSGWQLNVTLSALRPTDTDRYCCEFVADGSPYDRIIPGEADFFLYVADDAPTSVDVAHVETCEGGSAVLPCAPPPGRGQRAAVEGFSLKRRKGSAPVELLYHSKRHRHDPVSSAALLSSSGSSSSSSFPAEKLRFTTAPSDAGGMAFNLTLLHLQPRDSGFYSCTLLLAGAPQAGAGPSLGSRVFYVSVQGRQCNCSTYTTLLYALSAAAVLMMLLMAVVICWIQASARVKPQAPVPVYEEMVGVRPPKPKLGRCGLGTFHLEEGEVGEYSDTPVAKHRAENHYDSPCLLRPSQS